MLIIFGVLVGAVGLFAWRRPRADVVAILVVLALMLTRVLTPRESLAGFGDPVVILIAAIFIVGQALVNTRIAHHLGEIVMKAGGRNETRLIVLIMLFPRGIGAFMSSSARLDRMSYQEKVTGNLLYYAFALSVGSPAYLPHRVLREGEGIAVSALTKGPIAVIEPLVLMRTRQEEPGLVRIVRIHR